MSASKESGEPGRGGEPGPLDDVAGTPPGTPNGVIVGDLHFLVQSVEGRPKVGSTLLGLLLQGDADPVEYEVLVIDASSGDEVSRSRHKRRRHALRTRERLAEIARAAAEADPPTPSTSG